MVSAIVFFFISLIAWVLLTWPPGVQNFPVGVAAALFVSIVTGHFFLERPHLLGHPLRYGYFLFWYLPIFLWECFKANIDVARRVLDPRLPINPGIVKVNTILTSDAGITFLANSITLTPGTMSVDVDRERGVIYVHWIDVATSDVEEATQHIVRRFETVLAKIFE